MRQGGFVPKNHDSGVYWVRANAGSSVEKGKTTSFLSTLYWFVLVLCIIVGMVFS